MTQPLEIVPTSQELQQPFFEEFEAAFGPVQDRAQGFTIDNDRTADWALERILEEEADSERFIGSCRDKMAFIQAQIEQEILRYESKTAFLRSQLFAYMQNVKTRETKTQLSYRLPSGELHFKKPTLEYIRDDAAILAYCEASAPEFVKIVKSLAWAELKKRLDKVQVDATGAVVSDDALRAQYVAVDTETGEFVPGITVTEKPGIFSIKAAKGAKS